MNTLDEIKSVITALSERVNELEESKTNIVGMDDFLELQRENAVILEKLTDDISVNENQHSEKMLSLTLKKVYECLIPKPEVTPDFMIPQNEIDIVNKRIDDIKSILNEEYKYPDSEFDDESTDMDTFPLIVDNEEFSTIYIGEIKTYMTRIYEHLGSTEFWRVVVGTPVHAKINMLLRRLKSMLNVEDLSIFDDIKRDKVLRYVKAIAPSITSAYDIAESSVLWELESISNYISQAFDEASKWRYNKTSYSYEAKLNDDEILDTESESEESAGEIEASTIQLPLQFTGSSFRNDAIDARADAALSIMRATNSNKECASSENDDNTEDSSESGVDGTPNVNDTENIQTMEKEEPSEETSEIEAEGNKIGLILESESNNATSQNETSSDVDWDEVATCLFGYVNSAKRWINNDSVGDTGQIQIVNHMGNMLSTKSTDISGSYPIFANTINQLAIDAKKPVKLPATIEEFADSIKL